MNYIIYDLELNSKPFKSNLPNEIIEIGAVKLDDNLNKIDKFQSFVKPKYFKKLFSLVKKKTQITQDDINNADNFKSVIRKFRQWIGSDFILISWGHDDIYNLTLNCRFNRIKTEWLKKNIDIQKQFSSIFNLPPGQRYSLENALKLMGIDIKDNFHRALTDAEYTSKIFKGVFDKLNLQTFNTIKPFNKRTKRKI
ncbi:3'-5' exonuclease [Acetivibrio saccincola]|uniref:DNA polymerase III PolC-type n=1 Tax=Acetivibrio saccincola TaxID=1677857 RepID=A0A2K9EMV8_9FIRM|nr:3'-5' exonuclease [Acetivibrio saccincola]AUG57941.1 DNA polymerase III PolC-type [Acetivibrio saccincola]